MIVACFVRLVVNSVHLNKKKRGAVIVDAAIAKVLRIELFLHSESSFDLGYFLNYFQWERLVSNPFYHWIQLSQLRTTQKSMYYTLITKNHDKN